MTDSKKNFDEIYSSDKPVKTSPFADYFNQKFREDISDMKNYSNRKTGFENVDRLQTFSPGLYVLGGLPALGKTSFVWQLLEQLARNGEKCICCSYEMSEFELFSKSFARALFIRDGKKAITSAGIRRGEQSDSFSDIWEEFKTSSVDLNVMELHEHDIDELLTELKKYCDKKPPVIALDYLQIIPFKNKDVSAKQAVDDVVRKLKNFQRTTGTTFIVISSFNRQNYSQPVAFESFKESGNIEYSADVVWGLQLYMEKNFHDSSISKNRELIEQAKLASPRQVQLCCLKNRQGANYNCFFNYYPANDCFVPCNEDEFKKTTTRFKG